MPDYVAARTKMVDTQIRTEGVTDHRVLAAMGTVPRERFLPARLRDLAYSDDDLELTDTNAADPRYVIRPAALARLLQAAEIAPSDFALVVGCASGYGAAVLAQLASSVVALESEQTLADEASAILMDLEVDNVAVVSGPLEDGLASEGPYDVILVSGAVEVIGDSLFGQLREGGRLVAVVGYGRAAKASVFTKTDDDIGERAAFNAYLPPLPGFRKAAEFVF